MEQGDSRYLPPSRLRRAYGDVAPSLAEIAKWRAAELIDDQEASDLAAWRLMINDGRG